MANTELTFRIVEFIIMDDISHCNVFYESSEPGDPFWGGGWMTKSFPKEKSVIDFIHEELQGFINWPRGRQEYGKPA